jgi:hypothetical protein
MRRLIRLYPPHWRARYGDEFQQLLEEQPISFTTLFDILLGALDAQLERGRGGSTVATRLRTPPAVAITVGSLLWLVATLPGIRLLPGGNWALVVQVLGTLVVAVGVVGLGLLHEQGRSLALATAAVAAGGLVLTAIIETAYLVGIIPVFGEIQRWPTAIAVGGLVAEALFALVAFRGRVLPRIPLVAIAVLALALGVSAYLVPDYVMVGAVLLPAAWLVLGISILLTPTEAVVA